LAFSASSRTFAPPASADAPAGRIVGAGEMADLVRAFDWSSTPLGPIESWRDPLLACVNLLLSSRHPMFLWWGPDHIQFYNDAYRPSFGVGKHPAALGQTARQCWSEIWDMIEARLKFVMGEGQATWFENQIVPILRNGRLEEVYWTWSDSPIRDTQGNVVGIFVTCSETTDRVLAERELNRSRERLQLALEAADLGTWSYDPVAETFTADAKMQRIFGAPAPAGDHDFWQKLLHPDDRLAARDEFAAALEGVRNYNLEYRVLHPNGVRWIRSKGKVLAAEGESPGMFAIVEDITEDKLAQIALHERARDLRESERIGRMGSWRLILKTGELTWSEEVYRLMDHDPSLPVLNFAAQPEIIEEASNRRLQAAIEHCIATGECYEVDVKMFLPGSGRVVWLATRGEPVHGPDGSVAELRGTVRDITDRKLVEEALRGSEARLQLALQAARLGTWSYDESTGIGAADTTMQRMFGSSKELGDLDEWIEFMHPDDREGSLAGFRDAMAGKTSYEGEYRIIRPTDGEIRWIRSVGRIIQEQNGPLRMAAIVEDITDRKRTEAALLRTEKLAAVGRLAASIAHEINNPLEAITNLLYLARTSEDLDRSREYLAFAEAELHRASAITSQTLRFHKQSTRPMEVTSDDLIDNALGILRSRIMNAGVTIDRRYSARRPVMCFDGEIRQVVSNLLINAVDAMHPAGGHLLLRSREGRDHATGRAGLILTIADTGSGMSRETLTKIFEPFFTTKGAAGTGLGLWISKEIMERHRGYLHVRSSRRPDRSGTVFTLFLPFEAATR
jgi:PAS domain S-box-containing protein